jgi:hypothetical protein
LFGLSFGGFVVRNAFTAEAPRLTGLTERTFGVELELFFATAAGANAAWANIQHPLYGTAEGRGLPAQFFAFDGPAIIAGLAAVGIECKVEPYNHESVTRDGRPKTWWKLVTDVSVEGRCPVTGRLTYGIELVSPILRGAEGVAQVEKVSFVVTALHARVTKACGVHVHHGAIKGENPLSVTELKVLARLVTRFKTIFDGLLPASRRNNYFCRHFNAYDLSQIDRAQTWQQLAQLDRYRALNFAALAKHGTVEFRQHSGTFEALKLVSWILLTQGLVEKAKAGRGRKFEAGAVAATGDGFNNLMRAAGLRTCLPHGQKVAESNEEAVRAATTYFRERATEFGLISLTERSENRSRARTAAQTALTT